MSKSWVKRGHLVETLVFLLLVLGFLLGPLKLLGASWFAYLSADGLALLALLVVLGSRMAGRKPLFAASPLSMPLLLLAAYCVLELTNPEAPPIRSLLGLRSWLLYLGFYFVGLYTFRSQEQVERLYTLLLALGFLTGAYGVYQWQTGPQSFASWSDYYGRYAMLAWSGHSGAVFRAFSTFVAPGTFGGNMALLMLLGFSVAGSPRFRFRWRIAAAIALSVMAAGIGTSGSRGPVAHLLLAAVAALVLIPGVSPRVRLAVKACVVAGVAFLTVAFLVGPVVGERFATIFDPQALFWKWFGPLTYGIRIAVAHPFGMGLGYTAGVPQFVATDVFTELPTTNLDSGYGSAAAELGLPGLVLFGCVALTLGVEGVKTWKRLPASRLRDLLLGPALLCATYPIVSIIAQPQASLPSSIYFWLLIGILMKAPALQRSLDADQLLRPEVHPRQ